MLPDYPDIKVGITIDYGLTDIVADLRMTVVAAPAYFARKVPPATLQDLANHDCINLRLPTYGGLMAWEFVKAGHEVIARVEGQWVFNSSSQILRAALAGFGIARPGAGAPG